MVLFIWRHMSGSSVKISMLLLGASAGWVFFYMLEIAFVDLAPKVLVNKIQYIFSTIMISGLMMLTIQSAGLEKILSRRNIALYNMVPAICVLLALTNQWHGLFWPYHELETINGTVWVTHPHGAAYDTYIAYIFVSVLVMCAILIRTIIRPNTFYRKQAALILATIATPFLVHLPYVLGIDFWGPVNATQVAFTILLAPFTWGLLRLQVGEVIPIARSLVIDRMRDSVIVVDENLRIIDLNTSAKKLSKHLARNAVGLKINILIFDQHHTDSNYTTAKLSQHAISGDLILKLDRALELQSQNVLAIQFNEKTHYFDLNVSSLKDWKQKDFGFVAVMRDITARIEAENFLQEINVELEERVIERTEELQSANARLQVMDKFKSRLIDNISHELRTPVSNLVLYLDLISRTNKNGLNDKYLGVLNEQTERLRMLVENVVEISQLEMMIANAPYAPVNFVEIVQELVNLKESLITSNGLQLKTKFDVEDSIVFGNVSQITYMIENLLKNAYLYTNDGEIMVSVFSDVIQEYVVLEISDTGIGIDEEDLPNVFDQFFRGRVVSQSNISGIGLGLYVVKQVVELHKGEVVVSPRLEGGTTFQVKLPIYGITELV